MALSLLLVVAGACAIAVLASVLITRASSRSAAANMAFGALGGLALLGAALLIAFLVARSASN
jgi:hypothetical protein